MVAKQREITLGKCFRQRAKRQKNAREIVKPVAAVVEFLFLAAVFSAFFNTLYIIYAYMRVKAVLKKK